MMRYLSRLLITIIVAVPMFMGTVLADDKGKGDVKKKEYEKEIEKLEKQADKEDKKIEKLEEKEAELEKLKLKVAELEKLKVKNDDLAAMAERAAAKEIQKTEKLKEEVARTLDQVEASLLESTDLLNKINKIYSGNIRGDNLLHSVAESLQTMQQALKGLGTRIGTKGMGR